MTPKFNKDFFGKKYDAISLLSGGMDSTVALMKYMNERKIRPNKILALNIDYGQNPSEKEEEAAKKISDFLGTDFQHIELPFFKGFSIPYIKGDLKDVTRKEIEEIMKGEKEHVFQEWIPARNVVLVSVGSAYCGYHKAPELVTGFNVEGKLSPADNTASFSQLISRAIEEGVYGSPKLVTPLSELKENKEDVVKVGMKLNVPFEMTWSCYRNGKNPCLKCKPCIQREIAFERAEYSDPLIK
ncbi:MAG: 7-cyano-7-deazaguanine synthase [Candidatus Aenigmatarchaeota archaeon]